MTLSGRFRQEVSERVEHIVQEALTSFETRLATIAAEYMGLRSECRNDPGVAAATSSPSNHGSSQPTASQFRRRRQDTSAAQTASKNSAAQEGVPLSLAHHDRLVRVGSVAAF